MIKKILILSALYGLLIPVLGQNLDELLDQVDLKLRKDKKYLNIHYIEFPNNKINSSLVNLPRTNFRDPVSFKAQDNITYKVVFLQEAIGVDSMVVLYVDQITDKTGGGEKLFGEATGPVIDTERVLSYKDIYNIKKTRPEAYALILNEVYRFVRENPDNPPPTLLKINPDSEIKTSMGIASRDNTDFLNFQRVNNIHWYPKKVEKKVAGKRAAAVATSTDSIEYRLDAGFSSVSFSHKSMDFALGGASFELGMEDKFFNILPYSAMSVNSALRTLISLSDKKTDIDKALIIDAKLLARVALDMENIPGKIPFLAGSDPKLMLGSGAGIDLSITRVYGMPFINFYAMVGAAPALGTSKSLRQKLKDGTIAAFYNTQAASGSFSFYWNTSESNVARFRMDLGWAVYDMYQATYASMTSGQPTSKKIIKKLTDKIHPSVTTYFNFAPDGMEIYGGEVRLFESQLKATGWFKVLELEGGHIIRTSITYITPSVTRGKEYWENEGGAFVQVRYRYGF